MQTCDWICSTVTWMSQAWQKNKFTSVNTSQMKQNLLIKHYWLVVGPPLWKIWKSIGMIIPNIWENKKCSKPPTRLLCLCILCNCSTATTAPHVGATFPGIPSQLSTQDFGSGGVSSLELSCWFMISELRHITWWIRWFMVDIYSWWAYRPTYI